MTDTPKLDFAELSKKMAEAAAAMMGTAPKVTMPFDPFAIAKASGDIAMSLAMRPADLMKVQAEAAREWGDFWLRAVGQKEPGESPRDRRFRSDQWNDDPYYRSVRDAYLLASKQLRDLVDKGSGDDKSEAMARMLLDQYLNAVSPANYAFTNPDVVKKTKDTHGANLVQGFANLLEDIAAGKGIVKRRTDETRFVKGETIAATPGDIVFQNDLFQLIQYAPTTDSVAAEPLLYVPPLVNRYYMIDLVPEQSLVKWLVGEGRTVFVISWVNPGEEHKDKDVAAYVTEGVVSAIDQVAKRTGSAPDLFSFCLGGTLVAIALGYLAAEGRQDAVNSATLIGSLVDFADMRDWSAFVHEGHLTALEGHLEQQGYIDSVELQRLFAAMRANDLIWSSVVSHYLLGEDAPPSDLLTWFEDGARIPAAFLRSYNRELLKDNKLKDPAGFKVAGTPIDLAAITTPMLVIALKDDHVSAWEAVYGGARHMGADFILGGSGHNAGVINPPHRNKHGYWTGPKGASGKPRRLARKGQEERGQLVALVDEVAGCARGEQDRARSQGEEPDRTSAGQLCDDAVMDAMTETRDVLTYQEGLAGRLSLNRPKALHSLNRQMVRDMATALHEWRDDPDIRIILIDHSEGRGFCAGGDVVTIAKDVAGHEAAARAFFFDEYRLNHLEYTYPKPGVAFMDGVTMGGGVGIACPCRYRVATENTVLAMPETTIGIFPDVGGGRYLSRLRGRMAQFLALTGARLDGAECARLRLATHFVPSERLAEAKERIMAQPFRVQAILDELALPRIPEARIEANLPKIDHYFAADTLEEILAALDAGAAEGDEWAAKEAASVRRKSPTACKVSLRLLQESPYQLHFVDEMRMEYGIMVRLIRHPDFVEGVRALLIEKDGKPNWHPTNPEAIGARDIDIFFEPLPPEEEWRPFDF